MKSNPQTNAAWLYEKAYFMELSWQPGDTGKVNKHTLEMRNQWLYGLQWPDPPPALGAHGFVLETTYPGLLTGSGYPHEMGFEGELKLGFSFDYTTGLPYLAGSSVKGVLRHLFRQAGGAPLLTKLLLQATKAEALPPASLPEAGYTFLQELEEEIFTNRRLQAGQDPRTGQPTFEWVARSPAQRYRFLDAFVIPGESAKPILGPDFITPHLNRKDATYSAFTEPVPLAFLKVMPQVRFRFDFLLSDSQLWPALTAGRLEACFREILLILGAGAKTRNGYGQFADPEAQAESPQPSSLPPRRPATLPTGSGAKRNEPPKPTELQSHSQGDLRNAERRGGWITGEVLDNAGKQLRVRFLIDKQECEATFGYPASDRFPLGSLIKLKVKQANDPLNGRPPRFDMGGRL